MTIDKPTAGAVYEIMDCAHTTHLGISRDLIGELVMWDPRANPIRCTEGVAFRFTFVSRNHMSPGIWATMNALKLAVTAGINEWRE